MPSAFGQISLDSNTGSGPQNSGSSFSWTHTCTGSNLALVVAMDIRSANGNNPAATSVTYNGVALTRIDRQADSAYQAFSEELWYLKGPAAGAHTISVTLNGALGGSFPGFIGFSTSLTGVDQTNPLDVATGVQSAGYGIAGQSISFTTAKPYDWAIYNIWVDQPYATISYSGTQLYYVSNFAAAEMQGGYSGPLIQGPNTVTWGWGNGVYPNYASVAAFSPAATPPGTTYTISGQVTLAGVGLGGVTMTLSGDAAGYADVSSFNLVFGGTSLSNACYLTYNPSTSTLNLWNDAGTATTYGTPGSSGTLQNSQCSINLANTAVYGTGTVLDLQRTHHIQRRI